MSGNGREIQVNLFISYWDYSPALVGTSHRKRRGSGPDPSAWVTGTETSSEGRPAYRQFGFSILGLGGHIENPVDTWREAALTSPNSLVFTLRKEGRGERGREGSSRRRYDKGGKKRRGEG